MRSVGKERRGRGGNQVVQGYHLHDVGDWDGNEGAKWCNDDWIKMSQQRCGLQFGLG